MISIAPETSASSSVETLSVSRVTSTSPLVTTSPVDTCQLATFADVTDSPAAGTSTSTTSPPADTGAAAAGVATSATGAGVDAAAAGADAAAVSILATTVPMATSSPSWMRMWSVPDCSDSSSDETLSVSMVRRMSPFETLAPSATCHWATFADVTDSPAFGMITSNDICLVG